MLFLLINTVGKEFGSNGRRACNVQCTGGGIQDQRLLSARQSLDLACPKQRILPMILCELWCSSGFGACTLWLLRE